MLHFKPLHLYTVHSRANWWNSFESAVDWIAFPQISHVEALIPSVMVFGDEDFGR